MEKNNKGKNATFLAGAITGGVGLITGIRGLAGLAASLYGINNVAQLVASITSNPALFFGGLGGIAVGGVCLSIAAKAIAHNIRNIKNENAEKAVQTSSKEKGKEIFKDRIKEEPNKGVIKQAKKENLKGEKIR